LNISSVNLQISLQESTTSNTQNQIQNISISTANMQSHRHRGYHDTISLFHRSDYHNETQFSVFYFKVRGL